MQFYDLKQSGGEIQQILNSFSQMQLDYKKINENINNLPLKVITSSNSVNFSLDNIVDSGIYCIETSVVNQNNTNSISLLSDYIFLLHLTGNMNYKSQLLITQEIKSNNQIELTYYQRDSDKTGQWNEFTDVYKTMQLKINDMFKIVCWDESEVI